MPGKVSTCNDGAPVAKWRLYVRTLMVLQVRLGLGILVAILAHKVVRAF